MGMSFTIHPERRLAFFRTDGTLSISEGMTAFLDYAGHPRCDTTHALLTDAGALRKVDADFQSIVMAVQNSMTMIRLFRQDTRSIIYAPEDIAFGLGRLLQQVVEPVSRFRYEITRDPAHALAAAGQPEHSFAELEANLHLQPEGV